MEEPLSQDRRNFLKKIAAGTVSATVLLVYKQYANAEDAADPVSAAISGSAGATGDKQPDWAYVIQVDKCIGSGDCVRACSAENDVPSGMFRTWVERFIKTDEGIYVDSPNGGIEGFPEVDDEIAAAATEAWYVPKMCNHCHEPPCVPVCPTGASYQRENDNLVLVDQDKCIGCHSCVVACPYQVRFIPGNARGYYGKHKTPYEDVSYRGWQVGTAQKCTLCVHRIDEGLEPACVETCPTKTLVFGDLNDPDSEISELIRKRESFQPRAELGTDPCVFYLT